MRVRSGGGVGYLSLDGGSSLSSASWPGFGEQLAGGGPELAGCVEMALVDRAGGKAARVGPRTGVVVRR